MNARPGFVIAFVVIVVMPIFLAAIASMGNWRMSVEDFPMVLGLFVSLIGSFGLFIRAVAGASAIQLIGMAMVVLAGWVVTSPSWAPCIGIGMLGIAAAVVAWREPQG